MDGIILTPLKRIIHPHGDVYHALKSSDSTFFSYGEAYFTTVHLGSTKGWKKHTRMIMNLIVPVGRVHFYIHNESTKEAFSVCLGDHNYQRLTVLPGLWMAFRGVGDKVNMVLNIASIPHDPSEAVDAPLETFSL